MNYKIINVKDHKEYKEKAASFFASKWGIEESEYLKSIEESFTSTTYPMWYLAIENGTIIGGVGVIENDFHERKDLSPNICALYVEENRRNLGIAGALLNYAINDMKQKGITTLYLITIFLMLNVKAEKSPESMFIRSKLKIPFIKLFLRNLF